MNKIFLASIFLCLIFIKANAQEYPVDLGAVIIGGTASYSSSGGEDIEDSDGNRYNQLSFNPQVSYFVARNIFVGANISLATEKQGESKISTSGIGPSVGAAFGNASSTVYPFVQGGILFTSSKYKDSYGDSKDSGNTLFFGAGLLVPVKEHIGINISANYQILKSKNKDNDTEYSYNTISLGIGINGLLF